MKYLLLVFIVMPIIEMWLLITVGTQIGALATIGLVLFTAMLGAGLLRQQGFATLWRGQQKLQDGQLPATELAEGFILAVAGALLLTPGFFTDALGFAGLVPALRLWVARRVISRMVVVGGHGAGFGAQFGDRNNGQTKANNDDVIDGEAWERKDIEP